MDPGIGAPSGVERHGFARNPSDCLFHGLLHLMLWEGWTDAAFMAKHTSGFDALKARVREYTPKETARITGLAEADIVVDAADSFAVTYMLSDACFAVARPLVSASVIGTILASFALAATCVRVLMPLLAARLREGAVVSMAMLTTGIMFGLYPFMPSAWAMGACSVVLGITLGTVQPMIMSSLHQITPEARHGEALGLRMMTINASGVLMPMLFGSAGALLGVSLVFWTVGGVAALSARQAWLIGLRHGN